VAETHTADFDDFYIDFAVGYFGFQKIVDRFGPSAIPQVPRETSIVVPGLLFLLRFSA
jgi:hypothetical protein